MKKEKKGTDGSIGKISLVLLAALVFVWCLPASVSAWSYKEAARPYVGQEITILDEVTPLQESMKKIVPEFIKETGIKVNYALLNHVEVIEKGQADMLSGAGAYDAVMLHSPQMGLLLDAGMIRPIDEFMNNPSLRSPTLDLGDFIQPAWDSLAKFKGKTYGFLNWNYNQVYVARADLLNHPDEQKAFKSRYGYDLAPAETMQQMRDIAEFFTRKQGQKLAGNTLESDFYGIVLEGLKFTTTYHDVWNNYLRNWGGNIYDSQGRPSINSSENIAAVKFWASLWKFSPPGQAEYSLIDVPTVMGNGIAAQTILWSDFMLGIDNPSKSQFSGKFVYRGIPRNASYSGTRAAEAEPSSIVISKHSRNPEATYLFLQWIVEKTTQDRLFKAGGGTGVPVYENMWTSSILTQSRFSGLYRAMQDTLKYGRAKPKSPKHFAIMDVMGGIFQEIGLGKKSVEDGMQEGQRKALAICGNCLLQ